MNALTPQTLLFPARNMEEKEIRPWRTAAASAVAADGAAPPGPVVDELQVFLDGASEGPLTGSELDSAATKLISAWERARAPGQNASK